MGVALFLEKFLGVYLIIFSLLMLVRKEVMQKGFQEVLYIPGLLMLTGLISLTGGLAIILGLPFRLDGSIVVNILGILMVLKGIIRLGCPTICRDWGNLFIRDNKLWVWTSICCLLVGIFLVVYAFFMTEMKQGFFG